MKSSKRTWISALVVLIAAAGVAEARGRARRAPGRNPSAFRQHRRSEQNVRDRLDTVRRARLPDRIAFHDSSGDDTILRRGRRKARLGRAAPRAVSRTMAGPPAAPRLPGADNGGTSEPRSLKSDHRSSRPRPLFDEMDTSVKKKGNAETE